MAAYEQVNNSHIWENVRPFIDDSALYWFTDGTYSGIAAIEGAIKETFDKIKDETYAISNVQWLVLELTIAVCTYAFHWSGLVDGESREGFGRGTNVLRNIEGEWRIVHEHLSKQPSIDC